MSVDPLIQLLTSWGGIPLFGEGSVYIEQDGGQRELVTRVALDSIAGGDETTLRARLDSIRYTPDLVCIAYDFEHLLNCVHGKSIADIKNELGLTEWDGGPGTGEAVERILKCYFNPQESLNLTGLELTSLPSGIGNLHISSIWVPDERIDEASILMPNLEYVNNVATPLGLAIEEDRHQEMEARAAALQASSFADNEVNVSEGGMPQVSGLSDSQWDAVMSNFPSLPTSHAAPVAVRLPVGPVRFQISKGQCEVEPLWSDILMNQVREKYQGEDFSLVVDGYKMWGDETTSTITIKLLDGELLLKFTFDPSTGLLSTVVDQNGTNLELSKLKSLDSFWGKVLNTFAESVLESEGIKVNGSTIKVHPEAIKKFPATVLEKLTASVTNMRYLEDDFRVNSAIDVGGVSRQFVSDLTKALFVKIGISEPLIRLTTAQMLAFAESEPGMYQKFGKLLSFVLTCEYPLITGVYLNPKFYPLLKSAQGGLSTNQLAVRIIKETLDPSEMVLKALHWYENPTATTKSDALNCLRDSFGSELPDDAADIDIRKEIESDLLEPGINEAKAILKVLAGMTPSAKAKLAGIPDAMLSETIQGVSITAERVKAAIKMEGALSFPALEKRTWIFERIDENADNQEWLSNFVNFITGQPFLPADSSSTKSIKLKFLDVPNFNAHTCFSMLDVPIYVESKAAFLANLDVCVNDSKHFTTS